MNLSELPIGSIVIHPEVKYLGAVIEWEVVAKNHEGYPTNSITLQSKQIITAKAMDAQEPNNSLGNRRTEGNNNSPMANLSQWLNSSREDWYTAQHEADQSPDSSKVVTSNPYATEAGFLNNFPTQFINAILPTTLITVIPNIDGGGTAEETRKIFLPSRTEVGLGDELRGFPEGIKWERYTNDTRRVKTRTEEAIIQAESSIDYWWLRTPFYTSESRMRGVARAGSSTNIHARAGSYGVAPALNLPQDLKVSKTPNVDGHFEIILSHTLSNTKVNINGQPRSINAMYVNINGQAREVTGMYANINGQAKEVL